MSSENSPARKMIKLTESPEFVELILNGFIHNGIIEHSLNHNLASEAVLDQLKARQILHEYIYGIITHGEMPEDK